MEVGIYALSGVQVVSGVAGAYRAVRTTYVFDSSVADVLIVLAVAGVFCATSTRKENLWTAVWCAATGATWAVVKTAFVVAATGESAGWFELACCGVSLAACVSTLCSSVVLATRSQVRRKGELERALLEDGAAPKRELSMGDILVLLKPYFWPRAWGGRLAVFSTLFFVAASKVCTVVSPLLLATAANAVANGDPPSKAMKCALFYAGLSFASKVLKEAQSLAYLRVQKYAFVDLASDTFRHLHSLSLQWALSKKMGEVVRVTDRGIAGCNTFMQYGVLYIGPSIAEALAVCILFYVHFQLWTLSVLVFGSVVAYAVVTIKLTLWRKQFRAQMNKSDNQWHDRLTDSLVNFETVKYFTAEAYECKKFAEKISTYQQSSVEVQASLSFLNIIQQVILCGTLGGALALSAQAVHDGRSSVGGFVAVNVWVVNLFAPLNFLGTVYNALITAMVDLHNLSELLAEPPLVEDAPNAMTQLVPTSASSEVHNKGALSVEFADVHFHYPGTSAAHGGLRGVSFFVPAGGSLGIVGPTGAGKTTVGRLLFRFFDVHAGSVSVGGVDARTVTQRALRSLMGVVPQDTVLFNDTLEYNICYGKPVTATCAERDDAAKRAALWPFISRLELGWETVVGERGLKLSGGEKQRVAIARLFVKNPPIVLLDEATSALDSKTETAIQDALKELSETRTSISIAHRLGTIRKCDSILVLAEGTVLEQGSHEDLILKNGEYASMWKAQLASSTGDEAKD